MVTLVMILLLSVLVYVGASCLLTASQTPHVSRKTSRPPLASRRSPVLSVSRETESELFSEICQSWTERTFHWWKDDVTVDVPTWMKLVLE